MAYIKGHILHTYYYMDNLIAYHHVDAVLPHKFTVCSMQLKPFALGHYLILERCGNPIIDMNTVHTSLNDTIYWLFHAIMICGLNWENNILMLEDDKKYNKLMNEFFDNLLKSMEKTPNWSVIVELKKFARENYE